MNLDSFKAVPISIAAGSRLALENDTNNPKKKIIWEILSNNKILLHKKAESNQRRNEPSRKVLFTCSHLKFLTMIMFIILLFNLIHFRIDTMTHEKRMRSISVEVHCAE